MLQPTRKLASTRKGNCEASHFDGKGVDVDLILSFGNIWLCEECYEAEQKVVTLSNRVVKQAKDINSDIELSQDIYNAETVPFIKLQAAIQNNPEIPASQKQAALADACGDCIDTFSKAIFEANQTIKELQNKRLMWQQNMQKVVGSLHEKHQEKYKKYRVDYKETPAPTPGRSNRKPKAQPVVAYNKTALREASEKYGVPANTVRGLQLSNKTWTFEQAAKELAIMMGLLKRDNQVSN